MITSRLFIVFIIQRLGDFRYLGSVVEAAIERGHRVELWHDYSKPRGGIKDYQYPLVENTPSFASGDAVSRAYKNENALAGMLGSFSPDCVVASRGPTDYLAQEDAAAKKTPWVAVQEHFDYAMFGLDRITSVTVQCLYTPYWMNKILELYTQPSEYESLRARLESICRMTGSTQADGMKLVDPDEVRARWGIPSDRPVVTYLPSDAEYNLYGRVFLARNRLVKAAHILKARRWRNLKYLLQPFSDRTLVASVRRFCDRNNAFMLVKTRKKQPLPHYLQQAADLIVTDETEYPATILKALSVANLCISAYLSASINDAAAAGVPIVSLSRDLKSWPYQFPEKRFARNPYEVLFTTFERGFFNWGGFGYVLPVLTAIKQLYRMSLSDFPLDRNALQGFIEQYIGHLDGKNGNRVAQEIEALLGEGASRARVASPAPEVDSNRANRIEAD